MTSLHITATQNLESKSSEESVLSLTHELEKDGQHALLDYIVQKLEEGYHFSVHNKSLKQIRLQIDWVIR